MSTRNDYSAIRAAILEADAAGAPSVPDCPLCAQTLLAAELSEAHESLIERIVAGHATPQSRLVLAQLADAIAFCEADAAPGTH